MTRAATLRSLRDFFEEVADFRKARGQRYGLACYLTIAVAARMAGYRGVSAFAEFACLLDDSQKEAVGAFWSPGRERWTVPTESTFRYIFSNLKPDALDEALCDWALHVGGGGIVLGQTQAPEKSNETSAVRNLSRQLDLSGRTVTLDAMHNQQETARILRNECAADYVMTAVKDNRPTLHGDLRAIDWSASDRRHETLEKGDGRIRRRRRTVVDLGDPEWDARTNGTSTRLPRKPEMPAVRKRRRPRSRAPSPSSTIKTGVTSPPVHRQISTFAETCKLVRPAWAGSPWSGTCFAVD